MPYATVDFYKNNFLGEKIIDETEIEKNLILASEKIDEVTKNRIIGKGFENLTSFQRNKVMEATCFQANYVFTNGTESNNITSYNVLDIGVSIDSNKTMAAQLNMSDVAYSKIQQTGLATLIL